MRMLKALSLAAVIAGSAGAAQAQMVVIDPSAIGKQVEQLQQMVQQLNTMKQQLDQAQQLYGSLNKLTDMNSVASVPVTDIASVTRNIFPDPRLARSATPIASG